MIILEKVSKNYESGTVVTQALRDVTIKIDEGEMLAVMGTSGSGKTTLLNILGVMDTLTSGRYQFREIEVNRLSIRRLHQFRKQYVSFVFQNFELMNRYTVYENVEMPLLARGKHRYKKQVMEMLDYVGIADLANKRVTRLSGGEQQRCAIARALISDTPLILADEPTGALDEDTSIEIMKLMQNLNEKGKTIIIATHDMLVAEKCNRIVRLENGRTIVSKKTLNL